jgi:hypothetical protein
LRIAEWNPRRPRPAKTRRVPLPDPAALTLDVELAAACALYSQHGPLRHGMGDDLTTILSFDAPLWHKVGHVQPAGPTPCVTPENNNPAAFLVLKDDQSGSTRQQLQTAQIAGLSVHRCNSHNMPGCGACGLLEDRTVGVRRCVRIHGRGCHDICQGAISDPDSLSRLPVVGCMLPHDSSRRR